MIMRYPKQLSTLLILITTTFNNICGFAINPKESQTSHQLSTFSNDETSTRPTSTTTTTPPTIGFIGCGTIASAIATGLLTQTSLPIDEIYISKRSESKSSLLQSKFPNKVHVCTENQEICSKCDLLFLCVLPQQEKEVLTSLDISQDTILVSLVSTSKLQSLINNSGLKAEQVFKMICLPAVQELEGTPLLVPKTSTSTSTLYTLLSSLGSGTCIQCENESIMEAMMVSSCMMGPIYGLMKKNRDFLIKQGVPAQDASNVVGRQYFAMVKDAILECNTNPKRFDELIDEQTPGGLNEQSLGNLEMLGFMDDYEQAMSAVLGRIRGETDGSIDFSRDG